MEVLPNRIPRKSLNPGDHIYSWRHGGVYSHHGIYVGEERVIHFTPGGGQEVATGTSFDPVILSSSAPNTDGEPCTKCGDYPNTDGVIQSCLDCFLSGGDLYRYSYGVSRAFFLARVRGGTCTTAPSVPPQAVVDRATQLLEKGFGAYSLGGNNCEDFAICCKTGTRDGRSGQVSALIAGLTGVLAGFAMFCVHKLVFDNGVGRGHAETLVAGSAEEDEPENPSAEVE